MLPENPFDIRSLATGDALFGRDDELSWLTARLASGANLLLFGPDGVGKSSLLHQAGTDFAQKAGGVFIRLELSIHKNTSEVAAAVDRAASQVAGNLPSTRAAGVFGDGPLTRAGNEPMNTGIPGHSPPGAGEPLIKSLQQLNTLAQSRGISITVAFDSSQELTRLGGAALETALLDSTQRHLALGHVFAASEHAVAAQSAESLRSLHAILESTRLQPLEPHAFAQWIDRRLAAANIVSRGAGAACVDLGGPSTAQTIELAQRTFEFSLRARFANEASVRAALEQGVAQKSDGYAVLWQALSEPERKVVSMVARMGGLGFSDPETRKKLGVRDAGELNGIVRALADKRLVEAGGAGRLRVRSAMFKQWTLSGGMGLSRTVSDSLGTATRARFGFTFESSQAVSIPKVPRP